MPIAVKCVCGTITEFEDRFAGQAVTCPGCQGPLTVPVDPQHAMQALANTIKELEAYVGEQDNVRKDAELRGAGMTRKTKAVGIVAAVCLVGFALSFFIRDEALLAMAAVFGSIGALVLGLCFLASWAHDRAARHIQDCAKPQKALGRFLMAVRSGRCAPAYAALVPAARHAGPVAPLELQKIPLAPEPQRIEDVDSFKRYWKSVFRGPQSQNRSVTLQRVRKLKDLPADTAVVEAKLRFTSYPAWTAAIFGALILVLIQKRETKTVRKLMVRRGGMWFLLSGELEGELDRLAG
ncbi:MAG: hypothetical protein JXR37_34610 [Kiritimatiellae bacterium]|nr:hypothetical protein [Kiritimatiellia bacterium]